MLPASAQMVIRESVLRMLRRKRVSESQNFAAGGGSSKRQRLNRTAACESVSDARNIGTGFLANFE